MGFWVLRLGFLGSLGQGSFAVGVSTFGVLAAVPSNLKIRHTKNYNGKCKFPNPEP